MRHAAAAVQKKGTERLKCTVCNGNGKVHESKSSLLGTFTTVRICQSCHGNGTVPKEKCPLCKGFGVLRKEEEIAVAIPPGINDGEMIRLSGAGEAIPGGMPGDLYVKIHVRPDPKYRKEGANLITELKIKLTDALLGGVYTIPTLDGNVDVKVSAGISFGEVLRIKGKGVVMGRGRRGDLLIKIIITLPANLSRKAKKTIESLREEGV